MKSHKKVLVIGLDAGDQDLIGAYVQRGELPTFRRLLDTGLYAVTKNPPGLFVGAVWPSFWSGLSPARHGRYCYEQFDPDSYEDRRVNASQFDSVPFWDKLSEAGCRVAIIDVPKTSLSERINGIHIVDWGTHDGEVGFTVAPKSLQSEIAARHGIHPIGNRCDELNADLVGLTELREGLLDGVRRKVELSLDILGRENWDCFVTVFSETHCAGHQFWHLQDPQHPRYVATALEDALREVYVAMDAAVAKLIDAAGPDTFVFVLASHGMGPHYDATFVLDELLLRIERAAVKAPARAAAGALESLWEALPLVVRRPLRGLRAPAKRALRNVRVLPERSTRRCFAVPNNDVYGAIRVNLVGREPEGRVRPGEECERVYALVERELLAIENLETGAPLVKRVHRTADFYPGEPTTSLPDLLVEWDRSVPIREVSSPTIGRMAVDYRGGRTGDHKPEGLLLATGPGLKPGPMAARTSVQQIGSTIAALLGVRLDAGDAGPIPEILEGAVVAGASAGRR